MRASYVWRGKEAFYKMNKVLERKLNSVGRYLQTAIKKNISTPTYRKVKSASRKTRGTQIGKTKHGRRGSA